jgi:cytochrome d ubiquinol oxidase subunit II
MAYVSFLIPFVLAYIVYAWRSLEKKPISLKEMEEELDKY